MLSIIEMALPNLPNNFEKRQFKLLGTPEMFFARNIRDDGRSEGWPLVRTFPAHNVFSQLKPLNESHVEGLSDEQEDGYRYRVKIPKILVWGAYKIGVLEGGSRRSRKNRSKHRKAKKTRRNRH